MPYKSLAQMRYLNMLASQGKIKLNREEWDRETREHGGYANLPEHVADKKKKESKKSSDIDKLNSLLDGIFSILKKRRIRWF